MVNQFKYRYIKKIAKSKQLSAVGYVRTFFKRAESIFFTSSIDLLSCLNVFPSKYPRSLANIIWNSNSEAEPKAIFKNLANNGSLFIPQPSAILVGIDDDARRICEIRPYNSSFGKALVTEYMVRVNAWDFSQTVKSLKSFIANVIEIAADSRMIEAESILTNKRPSLIGILTKKIAIKRKQSTTS